MTLNDHQQIEEDRKALEGFGYTQELSRTLKFFSNFGVAFTYLSPVVGFYSLYAFGFQMGGPAFIWSIPIVVIGQLLVILIFSELAATFPLAGALYQWGRRLLGQTYGWFVGWIYGFALLITITAVDYGGAPYIANALGISNASQFILIGITLVMIVIQTLANMIGIQKLKFLINLGVAMEIIGTLGISIVLLFYIHQPASIVTTTQGVQGHGSYLPVFVMAMLFSGFIFYGMESAADVAEEVIDPQKRVPKAMITALIIGGITTMATVYVFQLATPNIALAMNGEKISDPVDYILTSNLGPTVSRLFLIVVDLAFLSCGAAVQAAATRVFYSYGRDQSIFGHKMLSYIHPKFKTPTNALWISAIIAFILSFSASFESILTSFAVVGIYISFQMIVLAAMIARIKGFRPKNSFNLGRWFWPVAIMGFVYGVSMIINLARPVTPTAPWYINYEVLLATGSIIVLGAVVYVLHKISTKQVEKVHVPNGF